MIKFPCKNWVSGQTFREYLAPSVVAVSLYRRNWSPFWFHVLLHVSALCCVELTCVHHAIPIPLSLSLFYLASSRAWNRRRKLDGLRNLCWNPFGHSFATRWSLPQIWMWSKNSSFFLESFHLKDMDWWFLFLFLQLSQTPSQVEFWICLLLTVLGYIPGIIYAIYVIVA